MTDNQPADLDDLDDVRDHWQAIADAQTERVRVLEEAINAINDFKPDPNSEAQPRDQIAIFAKQTVRTALASSGIAPAVDEA